MALLAGGDVLALLLFSANGRYNHGLPIFAMDTLRTADTFMAGSFSFSPFFFPVILRKKQRFIYFSLVKMEMWIDGMVFECILPWWLR